MTRRSATQQRLDPLGTLAAWPLSPAIAAIVLCYAVIATVLQQDQIQSPLLATLAVLAMAAAAGTLVIATQPANAPFNGSTNQGAVYSILSAPLSPHTTIFGGARYQALSSNVTPDYYEAAVFVGFRYVYR